MTVLAEQIAMIRHAAPLELRGTVSQVRGLAVCVADLPSPVGAQVLIKSKVQNRRSKGSRSESAGTSEMPVGLEIEAWAADGTLRNSDFGLAGEVVGFDQEQTIVMPIGTTAGIRSGDEVCSLQQRQTMRVGTALLGRVLNATGQPIDGKGPLTETVMRPLHPEPIDPLDRMLIDTPLCTGVRAIDALITVGRGQRLGVVAAPGVGKSVLLGMMAKATAADVSVIALVGERGREVRDFVDTHLGAEGLANSVVVCATSDEPPLLRLRAAMMATAIAEYFRDQRQDVLLIMDSVTRYCQAQRQIGLAAGEPPATKGYPPSVFSVLPQLLERCGRTRRGSITGFFAVLVEGDDLSDPIAEAARGVLDGHVQLSQKLAQRGHWPAVDVIESISRVCDEVTDAKQQSARRHVLRLLSAYRDVEDLLDIGAYAPGSNPDFDLAIACKPAIDKLLQQARNESTVEVGGFDRTCKQLFALIEQIDSARRQLDQSRRHASQGGGQSSS